MDILSSKHCKYYFYIFIIIALFFLYCRKIGNKENDNHLMTPVCDKKIERIGEGSFIIRYSSIIYNYKGRPINIPIYLGKCGSINLNELERIAKSGDLSILGHIVILVNKGEVKKNILECVKFYNKSFLKDINERIPTDIGFEHEGLIIWYDFMYEGIPSSMMIAAKAGVIDEQNELKFIDDIEVDEEHNMFRLRISIGTESPFKKKKK